MITIRPATKNEVKTLQDLNNEVFIDNQKYDEDLDMDWAQSEKGKEYFTKLLNNVESICLIAEDGDMKIGYLVAAPKIVSYRKSKYIEIENVGVIPAYRSKGIGTQLMQECLKIAKSRGFQKAFVIAYFNNTKAVKFYKRKDFAEIDVSLERIL